MSGQPVKTVEDQRRFKDEYMENLALTARLDDENLRANLIFSESGMIPPVSSLPDNRTVEDKMLDIEGLKQGIITDLQGLMNPTMAATFVQELMKSKFNTGNALLKFFSQRGPEFTKELLKKYKYGLADFNDIVGTLKFVEKYFLDAQESMVGIKDVAGRARVSTKRLTFDQGIELGKLIRQLQILLTRESNVSDADLEGLVPMIRDLERFRKVIPPDAIINKWGNDLTSVLNNFRVGESEIIKDLLQEYKNIQDSLASLPSYDFIQYIIFGIKKSLAYSGTPEEKLNKSVAYIISLYEELSRWLNETPERNLENLKERMKIFRLNLDNVMDTQKNTQEQTNNLVNRLFETRQDNPLMTDIGLNMVPIDRSRPSSNPNTELGNNFLTDEEAEIMRQIQQKEYAASRAAALPRGRTRFSPVVGPLNRDGFEIESIDNENETESGEVEPGEVLRGNGVRRRGRPKMRGGNISQPKIFETRIDYNSGIKASPDFVPFGAYLLNRRKINDGIISIKTMKGGTVIGYPNKRVSSNLSKVINQIIGGGVPSYELLSSLDDEEKAYLYKISKKTKLSDKLSIPSPSKDQTEKDIHNFEVMKGQILSGNDSKTLIKNFKILVLKLKTQGLLPKSQADELLSDLLSLGY
jgi:hypothetical protein